MPRDTVLEHTGDRIRTAELGEFAASRHDRRPSRAIHQRLSRREPVQHPRSGIFHGARKSTLERQRVLCSADLDDQTAQTRFIGGHSLFDGNQEHAARSNRDASTPVSAALPAPTASRMPDTQNTSPTPDNARRGHRQAGTHIVLIAAARRATPTVTVNHGTPDNTGIARSQASADAEPDRPVLDNAPGATSTAVTNARTRERP